MLKLMKMSKWLAGGLLAYAFAFGGCVSDVQFRDFAQTEFARITGDVIGQVFLLFVQSISPFSGA